MVFDNRHRVIKVFAHVAFGFGADNWNERYNKGQMIGINEPFAYGYHRANKLGCTVIYSNDKEESRLEKTFRLGLRYLLKFDFIHAWRNRKGIYAADVVWTHTESQHLAILLLFVLTQPRRKPKLIAQSVWLFDRWYRFPWINRWIFTKLLSQADVLTFLSPDNLRVARALFPHARAELVLFGCKAEDFVAPRIRPLSHPVRVISLGNDEHRDWETLIEAFQDLKGYELRIASQKINQKLLIGTGNISITKLNSNSELFQLYEWADMLVLALKPNLHSSGITVLQEAALLGIPIICSDVGGLRAYFSETEIKYVRPRDVLAIKGAVREVTTDVEGRQILAKRAQARMGKGGLSSQAYVETHVRLSKELLIKA
jgi:glycosyltransferase involved in cell wall biosynthesis